jgi:hypothetical protein
MAVLYFEQSNIGEAIRDAHWFQIPSHSCDDSGRSSRNEWKDWPDKVRIQETVDTHNAWSTTQYQVRMDDSIGQVRQMVGGMIGKAMSTKRGQL